MSQPTGQSSGQPEPGKKKTGGKSEHSKRVKVTSVYLRNKRSPKRYLVNVGGARSSKSHSIAQLFIERLVNCPGHKMLVTRKTFPALRLTAYQLVVDLLQEYGIYDRLEHDKVGHVLLNPENGARIVFLSCDDPNKIKSTEWNAIWMEEASEFDWADFVVFQTRLSARAHGDYRNQIFLSLNPDDETGWPNQRLLLDPNHAADTEYIHSSYADNPFLEPEYVALIEGLESQDPVSWQVFGLGVWGKLQHIIYQPYVVLPEFPASFDEVLYGVDFGFNVQSALIEIGIKDGIQVYLRQLIYKTHLTNSELIDMAKGLIPQARRRCPFYGDAAEPDRIQEFYNAGFTGIKPADKSDGSVKMGIDFCKRLTFHTLASNVDLNKERAAYKWRVDKNGNVMDEPVKFADHLMDAKRYPLWTHHKSRGNMPGIWAAG